MVAHHNTLALTLPTNRPLSQPSHSNLRETQMATWKRKGGGGHMETIEAPLRVARLEMSGWRCNIPHLSLKVVLSTGCVLTMLFQYFGLHLGIRGLRICRLYTVIHNKYHNVCSNQIAARSTR